MKYKNVLIPAAIIIILDQITKLLFTNQKYTIMGFEIIKYTENTGAAFSILEGYRWLFIAVAAAAIALLAYFTTKIAEQEKGLLITTGILIGGMTGNLIDRIFLGYVRDFINLGFWPTFNIADTAMFIAIILLIIHFFKR
ncbi:MAG: signal peptidase II [archaeon]